MNAILEAADADEHAGVGAIQLVRRLTGVLLTQVLPFADAQVLTLFEQFEGAIYNGAY